jgi:hypothetical protein
MAEKDLANEREADAEVAGKHPNIVCAPWTNLNAKRKQNATWTVPLTLTCKAAAQADAIGSDNGGQ